MRLTINPWPVREPDAHEVPAAFLPAAALVMEGTESVLAPARRGPMTISQHLWWCGGRDTLRLGYRWRAVDAPDVTVNLWMEGDARMVSVIVDHWVDGDCDTELMAEARITRDGTMAWIKRADPGQPIGQFSDELMDALARPATSPGFDGSNAVVVGGEFPSLHLDLGETVLRMWEMTPSVDEDGQLVCRQAWVCSDENWIPIVSPRNHGEGVLVRGPRGPDPLHSVAQHEGVPTVRHGLREVPGHSALPVIVVRSVGRRQAMPGRRVVPLDGWHSPHVWQDGQAVRPDAVVEERS